VPANLTIHLSSNPGGDAIPTHVLIGKFTMPWCLRREQLRRKNLGGGPVRIITAALEALPRPRASAICLDSIEAQRGVT
jgi:hypothetical protein